MRLLLLTSLIALAAAGSVTTAQDNPLAPQNPLAPANPLDPGNARAPDAPAQAGFPAWLKSGVRVTYESGDSIIPNTPNALQPDGKGNWFDTQGRAFQPGRGAVGITTYDQKGYTRLVYDIESGILIVLSTSRVDGNSNVIAHAKLLGIRQKTLPWMNDALPDWMGPNHQMDYAGVYNNIANGMESPMRYSFSLALGERHGNAVRATQTAAIDQGNGMPVIPTHADRVFASGGLGPLYISPQTLSRFQPGLVIDEDAPTKTRVSFMGVQNGLAFIADQRAIETYQFGYDTQTGMLRMVYMEKQQGMGALLRIQLQLANFR